jgi:hypothetical protein
MGKILKYGILIISVIIIGSVYWSYYFVFSEGVKGGTLNYFEKKGYIFKTWEGRVVQDGFQSPQAGALQSNEFRFSAKGDEVAEQLERAGGKFVELRYREYFNSLPWRGSSNFVVFEVIEISETGGRMNRALPIND